MKAFFIFIAALCFGMWWASENISRKDVIEFARGRHSEEWTPKIEYYLGVWDYTRSDWNIAAPTFEQMLAEYPTSQFSPAATVKLADCYFRVARRQDALALYQHYLEVWPEGELAPIAKKNVELLENK